MKIRRKADEEIAVDMSPMIDMVFLLLIFFIVASQIIKVEKVPIEIPDAVYAKVPEDETGRYSITVDPKGQLYVGTEMVSLDGLKERLIAEVDLDPKIRIVIRADGTVKYKVNEEIMEACAEAGANDLIFAAFEN